MKLQLASNLKQLKPFESIESVKAAGKESIQQTHASMDVPPLAFAILESDGLYRGVVFPNTLYDRYSIAYRAKQEGMKIVEIVNESALE